MPDVSTLLLFAVASFALIAIPGPSVLYIVTRSLERGRRAGLVSMLGVEAGALVHVAAAALGLSALPQFVDPGRGPVALQIGVLGLLFVALAVVSDSAYAFAAGGVGERLRGSERVRRWLDRVSGGVYLALGATAALAGERRHA